MKRLLALLVILALITAPAFADPGKLGDQTKPLKIFILAGQSNMQGYGIISAGKDEDLEHAAANDFKYLKDASGEWVERKDVWYFEKDGERISNLKVGYGALSQRFGPKIGPELAFGHEIGNHFEEQVLLIKCAWGGQSLAGPWRSPSAGPNPVDPEGEHTGRRYREMVEIVKDVTSNLKKYYPAYKGQGYEIAGFFWHQGWNDAYNPTNIDQYDENLVHFVADVRKEFKVANLPFIVATSGMGGKGGVMVKPQLIGAAKIDNCYAVDTIRFRGARVNKQISHWYNNATSYCKIGAYSAKAMTYAMQGKAPPSEIVGHVDPDTPNPKAGNNKKK